MALLRTGCGPRIGAAPPPQQLLMGRRTGLGLGPLIQELKRNSTLGVCRVGGVNYSA
jgi:hypothetical protein